MIDVFISYANKDKFFAELLAKILAEHNILTWRDSTSIRSGESWRDEIDLRCNHRFVARSNFYGFLKRAVTYNTRCQPAKQKTNF